MSKFTLPVTNTGIPQPQIVSSTRALKTKEPLQPLRDNRPEIRVLGLPPQLRAQLRRVDHITVVMPSISTLYQSESDIWEYV